MTTTRAYQRWHEIDLIKAASIVTVVLIHSINSGFGYQGRVEKILGAWSLFAVPSFLFAAGFLFPKSGPSTGTLARKLAHRILPPYLICSVIMLGMRATWLEPRLGSPSAFQWFAMFAFGQTGPIYYFVFVIGYLYALSLWWRKWPTRWVFVLWCFELVLIFVFYARLSWFFPKQSNLFWFILFRHPIVHLLPYLTGWLVSIHYAQIRPWLLRHAKGLIAGALLTDIVLVGLIQIVQKSPIDKWLSQVHIYTCLLALICIGICYPIKSRAVRLLSETSYAIYLIHFPIVRALQYLWTDSWHKHVTCGILVTWCMGTVCTVLLIATLKKLLGLRSKLIIGA
ncbi:acyltransferase [Planctomycetota bacterium]